MAVAIGQNQTGLTDSHSLAIFTYTEWLYFAYQKHSLDKTTDSLACTRVYWTPGEYSSVYSSTCVLIRAFWVWYTSASQYI